MSNAKGQRATSLPSIHVSWTSKEGNVIRSGGQTSKALIPVTSSAAKPRQGASLSKGNLPIDELPSVLRETNLQSISQEYNLQIDSFELIKCHCDHRADHFFDEGDLIMVYKEQLKAGLRFLLDEFYKAVLKFHHVSVAQVHPNSWQTRIAFRGLCRAKGLEPMAKVFTELHRLARRKDDEFWFFQAKPNYSLCTDLPCSLKN